jgi:hypothetical protein
MLLLAQMLRQNTVYMRTRDVKGGGGAWKFEFERES